MSYDDGVFEGKLFVLRSRLSGNVLDIEGNNPYPGAKVQMWTAKPLGENDNQIFYEDSMTGTIRSALSDLCLDLSGDSLVMSDFEIGKGSQQWNIVGDRVCNRENPNFVLDVAGNDTSCGARICGWDYNGGNNQHWTAEYMLPKFFMIRSKMCDKVLDVEGARTDPGTRVVLYKKNGQPNQLFYEDRTGVIRAKINKFAFDGSGNHIKLYPYDPMNPRQQWVFSGEFIQLRDDRDTVVDVEDESTWNGTKLCPYRRHGNTNQLFIIEYA